MNLRSRIKKRWLLLAAAIFGVALLGSGVFASSQITLNSGNAVSLGAGAAAVNVCDNSATISTQQYFNSSQQAYYTGTISIDNVDPTACVGRTLSAAFVRGGTVYTATWPITASYTSYVWGSSTVSDSAPNKYSASLLTSFDTAQSALATIAVAVQ
jgi:hypothetical protein